LPDDVVRKMGADIVIAVNLDNKFFDNNVNDNNLSIPKTGVRVLNIIRYHFARNCSRSGDIIIEPKVKEVGLVGWNKFFNGQESKEIIKTGEEVAIKVLPQIKNLIEERK